MIVFLLSLVLAAGGCAGLLLTARGSLWGPVVGLAVQPLWALLAILTGAFGLLVTTVMYTGANIVAFRRMRAARLEVRL